MKTLLLTNEYPPNVYGGAGMHVAELSRQLRNLISVEVRTFGDQREDAPGWRVQGYPAPNVRRSGDERLRPAWDAFARCLAMAADPSDADLVHCHTWYTHLGGLLVQHARRSRSSSPFIRSSRCGRGSASSWAGATTSRAGSSGLRSNRPMP